MVQRSRELYVIISARYLFFFSDESLTNEYVFEEIR